MRLPRSRALDEEVDEMRRCWGQRKKKNVESFPRVMRVILAQGPCCRVTEDSGADGVSDHVSGDFAVRL